MLYSLCVIILAVSRIRRIHKHSVWQIAHLFADDASAAVPMCVRPAGRGCSAARDAWRATRGTFPSSQCDR
jgi:hypothetical protein